MSTIKDGGPAFPAQPIQHLAGALSITQQSGMTLRDYFAAKAMAKLAPDVDALQTGDGFESNIRAISVVSYAIADAMLAARKGTQPESTSKTAHEFIVGDAVDVYHPGLEGSTQRGTVARTFNPQEGGVWVKSDEYGHTLFYALDRVSKVGGGV